MLAVEKWAEGQPLFLAIAAPQLATVAQDLHLAFRDAKYRKILTYDFPLPDLQEWLRLYRSHREPARFIRSLFCEFSSFAPTALSLGGSLNELSKGFQKSSNPSEILEEFSNLSPDVKGAHIQETQRSLNSVFEWTFQEIKEEIEDPPPSPQEKEQFLGYLSEYEPTAGFFFLVTVPCWLLYQEAPTRLYRRARQGDVKSLERLLRLDALLIHDPSLGKPIQSLRFNRKRNAYEELIHSVLKKPKVKITRKRMKYSVAGLISAIGQVFGSPLTEPEIRALFDAVAQDYRKESIDTDLPESPEAFAKAIQRDRAMWLTVLQPDKKS